MTLPRPKGAAWLNQIICISSLDKVNDVQLYIITYSKFSRDAFVPYFIFLSIYVSIIFTSRISSYMNFSLNKLYSDCVRLFYWSNFYHLLLWQNRSWSVKKRFQGYKLQGLYLQTPKLTTVLNAYTSRTIIIVLDV